MHQGGKKTSIRRFQGWNPKALFQEVFKPLVSSGDEVVFLSCHGLDSLIYRFAWEMRDWNVSMSQVPLEGRGRAWEIAHLNSFGFQAAGEKDLPKAKCIFIFSTIQEHFEKTRLASLISNLSQDHTLVVGFNLEPGAFERLDLGLKLNLLVEIICRTRGYDLRRGEEKIWQADGVTYSKGFLHLFQMLRLSKEDEIVFLPGYGVCHPFAFQIAWEIRETGAKMYVLPAADVQECRRITDYFPIGMQAGEKALPRRARYIVPLTGITVTFPYPEKVGEIIDSISGDERIILTENMWPQAFQKAGWDRTKGIDHQFTVDTDIQEINVFRVS